MADAKTWIDVADDAVKVGLGALIGGAVSLWATRMARSNEREKQLLERRLALLQDAQLDISKFVAAVSTFWANIRNAAFMRDTNEALSAKDKKELHENEQAVFALFAEMSAPRGTLLLLGKQEAAGALGDFMNACEEFFQIAVLDNPRSTQQALDAAKTEMTGKRTVFYRQMEVAFKRVPQR